MTEDAGTPDTDPDHIDPAGDIADLLEEGEHDVQLSPDQDPDELREFIQHIEETDEPTDAGTNAMVRIAKTMLEDADE
jgi:asparagine synthetase B (glutamine-hydrolysing)